MREHCPHCGSDKIVASMSSSLISIGIIPIYNIFCMDCGSLIKTTWKRPPEEFFKTPLTQEIAKDIIIPSIRPPEGIKENTYAEPACNCSDESSSTSNNDSITKDEASTLVGLINSSETPAILVKKLQEN